MKALPLAVLALAFALPLPAAGQSDETCITYMEADDAFREAEGAAFLDPAYRAALDRTIAANKEAAAASGRVSDALSADYAANRFPGPEYKAARAAELEAAKAADKASDAGEAILTALIEPAARAKAAAYAAAYAGPASDDPRVMAKLVMADRERCRARGM